MLPFQRLSMSLSVSVFLGDNQLERGKHMDLLSGSYTLVPSLLAGYLRPRSVQRFQSTPSPSHSPQRRASQRSVQYILEIMYLKANEMNPLQYLSFSLANLFPLAGLASEKAFLLDQISYISISCPVPFLFFLFLYLSLLSLSLSLFPFPFHLIPFVSVLFPFPFLLLFVFSLNPLSLISFFSFLFPFSLSLNLCLSSLSLLFSFLIS